MSMPTIRASQTTRHQAITDIIESIALEESAVAHILNAEGEKLQKVVCFSDLSVEDIVAVNNSISDIIHHICAFENEIKGKLEIFKDCICCDHEDI